MWMLALVTVLLVAGGCAGTRERAKSVIEPEVRDTADSFRRSCAPCHGLDGRGDGPVAATLRGPAPDITVLAAHNGGVYPRDRVIATILGENVVTAHGTREMPVWCASFEPPSGATAAAAFWARRRVELLADYVGTLQRPADGPPPDAGAPGVRTPARPR